MHTAQCRTAAMTVLSWQREKLKTLLLVYLSLISLFIPIHIFNQLFFYDYSVLNCKSVLRVRVLSTPSNLAKEGDHHRTHFTRG